MATITSTGIGSGLDVSSIITQLMAVENRPLNLLQQAKTDLNTQLSAIGKMQSLTSAMRDAAQKLTSSSLWSQTVATSSDTSAVNVTTAGGALAGRYAVSVQSLAAGQTVTSGTWGSADDKLGEGTLTIELGTWTGADAPADFTPKAGAAALTLTIGPEDTSLSSIRDKINAAGAGVSASIINDASGSRMVIRSTGTGAESAFRITAAETVDDGSASTGLSALAYSAGDAASPMTRYQTAANAMATVNGIPVSSATNQLDGVLDGITLTLAKTTTTTDVIVDVAADDAGAKAAINTFTKAFNDLAAYIRDQTKYDATAKAGGTLQGDRTALGLQSQLRNVINEGSAASDTFGRLADVGITMQADGTLAVNSTKLDAALKNRTELRKLLVTDGADSASSGFMDRFRDLGNTVLNDGGSIATRTSSLGAMIKRNDSSQERMQDRLTQTEARLRKQYQTLDANMAKLTGLSSYLTGQLAALAKNSNG